MFPEDLWYSRDHVWTRRERGGWRVGLTAPLASQLTWVTRVRLPPPGTHVAAGADVASVEATKVTWAVPAPFAGTVCEVNDELSGHLERMQDVRRDPYGQGWLAVLLPDDAEAPYQLLDARAYRDHLSAGGEGGHTSAPPDAQ